MKIKQPRPSAGYISWAKSAFHHVPPGFGNWKPLTICGARPRRPYQRQKDRPEQEGAICRTCDAMVAGTWNP